MLLVALVVVLHLPVAAQDPWSGHLVVIEREQLPPAPIAERTELTAYLADLTARLGRAEARLATARSAERMILLSDIGVFTSEQQLARRRLGGSVVIDQRRYAVAGSVLRMARRGQVLWVDRAQDGVALATYAGRTAVSLGVPPQPSAALSFEAGPPFQNYPTQTTTIMVAQRPFTVQIAPALPNVYSLSYLTSSSDDPLFSALASLPGMPVAVSGQRGATTVTITVAALRAAEVPPAALALPRQWHPGTDLSHDPFAIISEDRL